MRLAPERESPARARRVIDEMFETWGCEELTDDAKVVVSELVTNAVRHARTELDLNLSLHPTEIRIAVTDHSGVGDVVPSRGVGSTSTGGRGLRMVQLLADEWGVEHRAGDPSGKTVWAAWLLPR